MLAPLHLQVTETTLQSKEQNLVTAEAALQAARQELQARDRQLGSMAADLHGGESCREQACRDAADQACRLSTMSSLQPHAGQT